MSFVITPGTVYFLGAGPGSPDLLTLRAKAVIDAADFILYADSLVDPAVCASAKAGVNVEGSSKLTLEEQIERMVEVARGGGIVARIQSGDPAVYGAIAEQMLLLDEAGVPYAVVPGVSSVFAAASLLPAELTVPGGSQTIILCRYSGRTGTRPKESIQSLAQHDATLAIFLAAARVHEVVAELTAAGVADVTPAALVYRATWPDEKVYRTTVGGLVETTRTAKITRQALILVGEALAFNGGARSHLYEPAYTHLFRRGIRTA